MNGKTLRAAWRLLTPRERRMASVVVLMAILGGGAQVLMIGAVMPFLTFISDADGVSSGLLADLQSDLGIEDRYAFAVILGGAAIGAIVISNAILLARGYVIARFTLMRVHAISTRLFSSYLDRPYAFFLGRNSGDISKRLLSETSEIANSFLLPAAELVASGISAIFILSFLLVVQPGPTLAGIGVIAVIYAVIQVFSGRYLRRIGAERVDANQARFLTVNEIFGAIKDVKTHGTENVYRARFDDASKRMLRATWKSKVASESPRFLIQALFFSAIVVACLAFLDPDQFRAASGSVSDMIPVLGVLALAGQRLVPEIQKIYAATSKISFGGAAIASVAEDMARPASASAKPAIRISMDRDIAFENVGYRYPGSEAGIHDVTLRIPKGQRVGIVGGTGAGKTTLVDLVLGLLQPDSGAVFVDGTDISGRSARTAWKARVSYVPQSVYLADSTIAENIAFGVRKADIDYDKVRDCARIAQIHEHIEANLPEGYHTRAGERGAMLSGGQIQRLGIARALYREADLVVLDEATSALDQETEREVIRAIDAIPRSLTVVMIAHRLETLRGCDRLLVMDGGRLAEDGSWADLEGQGGIFAKLVSGAAAKGET